MRWCVRWRCLSVFVCTAARLEGDWQTNGAPEALPPCSSVCLFLFLHPPAVFILGFVSLHIMWQHYNDNGNYGLSLLRHTHYHRASEKESNDKSWSAMVVFFSLKRQPDILEWCVLFSHFFFLSIFYYCSKLIMVANTWKDDNRLTTWAWKTSSTFKQAFHAVLDVGVKGLIFLDSLALSLSSFSNPIIKYSKLICIYNVITDLLLVILDMAGRTHMQQFDLCAWITTKQAWGLRFRVNIFFWTSQSVQL